jgi:hypothetical protein
MGFFDLFKDKKKEFAPVIYGLFRPRIEVVKKYGKWNKDLSFGESFILNEYLIAFLNMYINMVAKANSIEGIEVGKLAAKVYEEMDPVFKDFSKLKILMDRYHDLSSKGSKEFKLATDECFMFYNIVTNHPAIKEFTDNPIYKKANKYFMSGQAKKDHDFSKKLMLKNMHNSEIMDNALPNLLLANKIFELTFVNKLNKFFKYD